MRHKLSNIDPETLTGTCSVCGATRLKVRHSTGRLKYTCRNREAQTLKAYNSTPARREYLRRRAREHPQISPHYRRHLKEACERCGLRPEYPILEVHHRDHNRGHNKPDNLETICPNCHAIEHYLDRQAAKGVV